MFQFLSRRNNNPNIGVGSVPNDLYDAPYLGMHQRALRGTMYGLGDIIRAVIDEGKVKFQYTRNPGKLFSNPQEAFQEAAKDGVTTFSRLTGRLQDSSTNTRGLAGLEQRLIEMQNFLSQNPIISARLGINDPSQIYFETGTFKSPLGAKQSMEAISKRLKDRTTGKTMGLVVPDDNEFNLLQVFVGQPGKGRRLSIDEMSKLFSYTSEGSGGLFGAGALVEALKDDKLGSLFSKAGKRFRGAIGIRDLSLTGDVLSDILADAGIQGTGLTEQNVKVLKISEDLTTITKNYQELVRITGKTDFISHVGIPDASGRLVSQNVEDFIMRGLGEEEKLYYGGSTGILDLVSGALKTAQITGDIDSATDEQRKLLKEAFKAQFDGTAVINEKFFRSTQKHLEAQLKQLERMPRSAQINAKILELRSQLDNLKDGNFQAITTRTFFEYENAPNMIKAVVDKAKLRGKLSKYAMLVPDVALKKEAGLMGKTSAMNLVLQGQPSERVYYDPLAPAFHNNIFSSPEVIAGQEKRQARLVASLKKAFETGEIDPAMRRQINRAAEFSQEYLNGLPAAQRASAERTRLYMRKLQEAMESGVDIRTMPQMFNYLLKTVQADLFREKDNFFQPALEDAFRVSIDSEQSFLGGRVDHIGATLGQGYRTINMQGMPSPINAVEFTVRGHKMLMGGNAAQIFKHSLGGFDFDDKAIIMPRVLQDASGGQRLSTFIFRQPTGPGEFIFGTPQFSTTDTIKMFLANNDALMGEFDVLKNLETELKKLERMPRSAEIDEKIQRLRSRLGNLTSEDEYLDLIKRSVDAGGPEKILLDRKLAKLARREAIATPGQAGAIEKRILQLMNSAQETGSYTVKTISSTDAIMEMLARAPDGAASPIQLTKDNVSELLRRGTDFVDEQFLVNQYNYGSILRVFKEEADKIGFDDEAQQDFRRILGQNKNFTTKEIADEISAADVNRAVELKAAVESMYGRMSLSALGKEENIGQYINKMLVATASSDQEEAIFDALRQAGRTREVEEIIGKTTAAILSPSDVVDMITNMGTGSKRKLFSLANESTAQILESLYKTDPIIAEKAINRILGQNGSSLSQDVADAAIKAKFERIGRLRAMAMEAGLSDDLVAGIDPEFIKARLKNDDSMLAAMKALETGFGDQAGNMIATNQDMANYLARIQTAQTLENGAMLNEELIKIAGMSANSQFAHASAMARVGQSAVDVMSSLDDMFDARMTMANMAEANFSRESTVLAENILNEYKRMSEDSSSLLSAMERGTKDEADFMKYQSAVKQGEIGERIRSMIMAAAEGSESSTVQDILDNMERLSLTSRMRSTRGYSKLLTATGDENDIFNMVTAAQQSRRIKSLERQENIKNLADQLDEMLEQTKQMSSQDRADILQQSRDVIDSHIRMRTTGTVSDDHRLAAALLNFYNDPATGLDEETLKISQRVVELSRTRRNFAETGMADVLGFGGRSSASNFAPQPTDLDEDTQRRLFAGLDDQPSPQNIAPSTYKRITESWKDGKLGEAFGNPIVKKSAYAVAGLIAASFIYSGVKDRGEQEISGPPLLPGGSAYEQLPQRTPQIPNQSMFSGYNRGTGYTVHLEGSREQIESFGQSAGSVARGPINSTMSRGLPRLGRDPYSEIAGSF